MRVIEPKQIYLNRRRRQQIRWRRITVAVVVIIFLVSSSYSAFALSRPLPTAIGQPIVVNYPGQSVSIRWPGFGQSAVGVTGQGLLAASGSQTAVPIASIAKVMTALVVLHKSPITVGQPGPTYTLTSADVDLYNQDLAQGGSVAAVSVGEQIDQYQMLEGMLLPSANNLADSLAIKVFGSLPAYLDYANTLAKSLGLSHSHIADASGFSPETVATASDLVKLGLAAMSQPVLAQIVGQTGATIPVEGPIQNVNFLLGQAGIIGIKTGNTDQAGGCYLFAARHKFDGGPTITVVGATLGAATLGQAVQVAPDLLTSVYSGFSKINVVKAGQTVGSYGSAWGGQVSAVAQADLSVFGWRGDGLSPVVHLQNLAAPQASGTRVGSVDVAAGETHTTVPVVLSKPLPSPSLEWRLLDNWH